MTDVVIAPALSAAAVLSALGSARSISHRVPLPPSQETASPRRRRGRTARRLTRWIGSRPWVRRISGFGARPLGRADAQRLGCAALIGLAVAFLFVFSPAPGPFVAPIAALVAVRAPLFAEERMARRRRAAIDAELPQFLDALAAASTAGLSVALGVRRASEVVSGPLKEELRTALAAVDLGGRLREALRTMADRSGVADLRRAVAVITRTETLGSSLADSTIELAERVRENRRQRLTEKARTAPVKMLFPLVFLVLPAFLLLTVVPVLLTTLLSIR